MTRKTATKMHRHYVPALAPGDVRLAIWLVDHIPPYEAGDEVTIMWRDGMPMILDCQRYANIARVEAEAVGLSDGLLRTSNRYWVTVGGSFPRDEQFGPIKHHELLPGWIDDDGRPRRW